MDSFKNFDFKKISIPKAIGFLVLGLVLFVVVTSVIGFGFRTVLNTGGYGSGVSYQNESSRDYYASDAAYVEESMKLSMSNILPPMPGEDYTTGDDAESFEITDYNGYIETGNLDRDCNRIEALKVSEFVIFENANRNDKNCNYTFKVKNEEVAIVIDVIKELKPESLNENTHTIKNLVDGYTSEVEILEKKLESIEETLTDAQAAYDQVEILATRTQDVESLATIIDSKIKLIERLSTERINIKERIDRINREKAEQIDRLNYTFFNINVYENKLVDFENLKDSWVWELKRLVNELSGMLQALTTGLLIFVFQAIPVAIYLIVALFILKYGWRGAKYMWKK